MFNALVLAALLPAVSVFAIPTPTGPAPNETFNEGATCSIAWTADPTSGWTTMNIELMTGDNFNMVHLTTVATVDGTNAANATFDYTCPQVIPNSPIYFYQFSSPSQPTNLTWTGRFAIADANGNTTPPPNATQPDGEAIPWGTGQLVDPSTAVPAPSYLNGGAAPASTTIDSGSASAPPAPVPSSAGPTAGDTGSGGNNAPANEPSSPSPNDGAVATAPTGSPSSSPSGASTNAASAVILDLKSHSMQAIAALFGTTLVFVTML